MYKSGQWCNDIETKNISIMKTLTTLNNYATKEIKTTGNTVIWIKLDNHFDYYLSNDFNVALSDGEEVTVCVNDILSESLNGKHAITIRLAYTGNITKKEYNETYYAVLTGYKLGVKVHIASLKGLQVVTDLRSELEKQCEEYKNYSFAVLSSSVVVANLNDKIDLMTIEYFKY